MSPKRRPAAPPDLPGFTYIDVLGSGGFADVYLYEQHLPKRRVAVKVLLTERMASGAVEEFTAEANVMAMLSTHPAIVTIYQAGVADDGRPYLVMEYCPKPNLQVRYRRERFSVAEALRVGVQVAGAVETAHRAGVLHRDIKPANILVTEYNRPALTDFGIASTTNAAAESAGLSIPWSPPESFGDIPFSDARSDVWALGATVYSLLAGRSPFEVPGQRNGAADLIHRIETQPLTAIDRQDVPASLRGALDRAMSKPAGARFDTALAFARALQKVQIELALGVTPVDILDDGLPEEVEEDEDDGLTRVRGVVSIDPQTSPAAGATRASATTRPGQATGPTQPAYTAPTVPAATSAVPPVWGSPPTDETVLRGSAAAAAPVLPSPFAGPASVDETVARRRKNLRAGVQVRTT
ncbi:MAG TPA: protein kinase, partial [Microbacterium sp.]|uniref:serine/threonine-protein kinase n=1 Tax=Microbacterium sp. TaxID=51671 RepID=UPI002B496D04